MSRFAVFKIFSRNYIYDYLERGETMQENESSVIGWTGDYNWKEGVGMKVKRNSEFETCWAWKVH